MSMIDEGNLNKMHYEHVDNIKAYIEKNYDVKLDRWQEKFINEKVEAIIDRFLRPLLDPNSDSNEHIESLAYMASLQDVLVGLNLRK